MRWPNFPPTLSIENLSHGVAYLGDIDPDFARINAAYGPPPLWARPTGFPTLVRIILEQQVSLASAGAAFGKLEGAIGKVTPETFLTLDDGELKKIGFSRQKAGYCRGLASAIIENQIDLNALEAMDDPSAHSALMQIKGIGPWTADIYLLMALLRPDIWPGGDLALATAYQTLKGLSNRLDSEELNQIAQAWRPWRAVAARLLWHYYLSQ